MCESIASTVNLHLAIITLLLPTLDLFQPCYYFNRVNVVVTLFVYHVVSKESKVQAKKAKVEIQANRKKY